MSLTRHEIFVKALLEGYEELQEKKYTGKWHLSDELADLDTAIGLAGLTEKQRAVLTLVYFQHMEQSEAARVVGTSQQSISLHLQASIKKIANIYEQWEALEYAN